MKKTLKSLVEHNKKISKYYYPGNTPETNGISCPDCGEELLDSRPNNILMSHPPQKNTHCNNCDYTGYRIA